MSALLKSVYLAAATTAVLALSSPALAKVTTGEAAPNFTAIDSNGVTHNLSDFAGKTVVLEWTNDGCPYVKKHYSAGNMQAMQKAAADDGVVWLSVVSSAPGKQGHVDGAAANALSASRGAQPTAVLLDEAGAVGRLYDAQTTPHMYVINPEGVLAYQGAIDSDRSADPAKIATAVNYVSGALAAVEAGQLADPAQTKAYGCSVKY